MCEYVMTDKAFVEPMQNMPKVETVLPKRKYLRIDIPLPNILASNTLMHLLMRAMLRTDKLLPQ
jgi:hypothetical protein